MFEHLQILKQNLMLFKNIIILKSKIHLKTNF